MYPTVLLPIAKTLKQQKCPRTDEYIKKEWYMPTMEYYSVMKKKEWANSYRSNMHESSCHQNEWCKSEKKDKYHILVESEHWRPWTNSQKRNSLSKLEYKIMVTRRERWGKVLIGRLGLTNPQ